MVKYRYQTKNKDAEGKIRCLGMSFHDMRELLDEILKIIEEASK